MTTKLKEQDDLNITPLVFVYGTLKYGYGNWRWLLQGEEYLGPAITNEKYVLGDIGFPYMFKDAENAVPDELLKPVLGDLFKVSDDKTVKGLDNLEGEGHHYHRELMYTTTGDKAWAYFNKDLSDISRCYKCDTTEDDEWVWQQATRFS